MQALLLTALAVVAVAVAAEAPATGCPIVGGPFNSQACTSQAATAATVAAVGADTDAANSVGELVSLAQRLAHRRKPVKTPQLLDGGDTPIAFIETHRTGSSTMASILNRMVLRRNLTKIFPNDGEVINWPIMRAAVKPNHQFDVVYNHQVFDEEAVRAYLRPRPFIFSIAREPMAMTDSIFRYVEDLKSQGEHVRSSRSTWASRLHRVEVEGRPRYANPLARDFGWYNGLDDRSNTPEGDSIFRNDTDEEAIRDFIKKIDRATDLVILTENYDEGLVLLKRKLKLKTDDVAYFRMKKSTPADIPPPTPEEESKLKELLHVDTALYDYFSKRFWSQWNAFGGYAALRSDLSALKQKNKELEMHCVEKPRNETLCPLDFTWDGTMFNQELRAMQKAS